MRDRFDRLNQKRPGKLKIYLGYAAGVGKTYQMMEEGQALLRQGTDVVIGYFEPHGRADTITKSEGLPQIPRKKICYRGAEFEEMDVDSVLRRHPAICLVDELAHTNIPGSEHTKRWEDVQTLLEAGIDVISTVNVQHIESFNDQVKQITGIRVRETLPDWVVDEAVEVIVVDVTPQALRNRLERGAIYRPEKAEQALRNFFTEQNLSSLRELAFRHAAHEVEGRLTNHSPRHAGIPSRIGKNKTSNKGRRERILICLDEKPFAAMLIRRGKRVADYLQGDCLAIHVLPGLNWDRIPPKDRAALEKHLTFAKNLRIHTQIVDGSRIPDALVAFAREQNITQIYLGRTRTRYRSSPFHKDVVHGVVALAKDMQVVIVSERHR
jgi:two-component system, OmpR family, sensor histidine kinase KdpD